MPAPNGRERRLLLAGGSLGFALGGFFDGILLHQILQWHHLLSAIDAPAFRDIRVQILADGLFHALMYVIAAAGLWLLWRGRDALAAGRVTGRALAGVALIGFGVWHMLDGVLSHWLLGIHRIRMDVEDKLFWDLLWFVIFGVAVAVAGWWLQRSDRNAAPPTGGGGRRRVVPVLLALLVTIAGPVAALPPPGATATMVVFRPGTGAAEVAAALAAVNGRMVWSDPSGRLWAFDLPEPGSGWRLYRHGALLVGNTLLPAGCLNGVRTGPAR
ncbi:hypothetical protein TSO352_29075 [Azospirillum sp. TSO35-2]|nr:hypothetical protein TSO352_29075 [Azospirillum sp. TSO35-2]